LNEIEVDADLEDIMSKVSSFYSKDNITFEKKMCNFIVMKVGDGDYQTEVANIEVNMAEYVNHHDSPQHINIPSDDYPGLFLDVMWTIVETDGTKGGIDRGSTIGGSGLDLGFGSDVSKLSEEQLMEIFEKARALEDQNADLEKQIDLVISAKNNLEKILGEERKATAALKA
jgi:hypothetical protein